MDFFVSPKELEAISFSGMNLTYGARGPEFNSRNAPHAIIAIIMFIIEHVYDVKNCISTSWPRNLVLRCSL